MTSLFRKAMDKEWSQFLEFGAVEVMSEEDSLKYADQAIGMRWVNTDKNVRRNLCVDPRFLDAKSRLVVQGHMAKDLGMFRSDAPTSSLLDRADCC